MRPFTIYSFYTQNSPYKEIYEKYLLNSVKKLNLEINVLEAPNYHHWGKNVAQKPLMILQLLEKGIDNIVFLDADATIESFPSLFGEIPEEFDIAFHTLHWNTWYNRPKDTTTELLSGTLFLRNRPKVIELCHEWYNKAQDGNCWEQTVLQNIIKKYDLKIYNLPIGYVWINSLPGGKEPHVKCDNVVIRHYQKSREIKKGGLI